MFLSSLSRPQQKFQRRISFFSLSFLFYIFVGGPGASSFGRCRDASLPCVDRRGFGGHGHERNSMFSTKKKREIIDDATRCKSEVRSTGARREKRRKLQAPKARGGSWLATAVPCCLWAGEEEERGGKSVGEVFFFFSFFFPLPPPHRHGKASGQKLPVIVQKPSPPEAR